MGQRGPKPTPTKLLHLRGSWRAKGREGREPTPAPVARFDPPAWLSPEAKQVWGRVIRHLKPLGLITRLDMHVMARYCELFVMWRHAAEYVNHYGLHQPIKNAKDKVIGMRIAPYARMMVTLSTELLKIEREFGMTPSARASFGIEREGGGQAHEDPQGKSRFFDMDS
jgi:P27 family predicted phage terminase small subunit